MFFTSRWMIIFIATVFLIQTMEILGAGKGPAGKNAVPKKQERDQIQKPKSNSGRKENKKIGPESKRPVNNEHSSNEVEKALRDASKSLSGGLFTKKTKDVLNKMKPSDVTKFSKTDNSVEIEGKVKPNTTVKFKSAHYQSGDKNVPKEVLKKHESIIKEHEKFARNQEKNIDTLLRKQQKDIEDLVRKQQKDIDDIIKKQQQFME